MKWKFREDVLTQYINSSSSRTFQEAEDRLNYLENNIEQMKFNEKIEYTNNAKDCFDNEWAKSYVKIKGTDSWKGTIEIKEKREDFVLAKVNCRETQFIISLTRYFYMKKPFYSEEWCVCVPNFEFGGKVAYLEKYSVYEMVHEYIPNVVDSISCTNAIMVLMSDVIKRYHEYVVGVMNER